MESMSAMPAICSANEQAHVDDIEGMQPTVAIEQRVTGVQESQRLVQSQKLHSI